MPVLNLYVGYASLATENGGLDRCIFCFSQVWIFLMPSRLLAVHMDSYCCIFSEIDEVRVAPMA